MKYAHWIFRFLCSLAHKRILYMPQSHYISELHTIIFQNIKTKKKSINASTNLLRAKKMTNKKINPNDEFKKKKKNLFKYEKKGKWKFYLMTRMQKNNKLRLVKAKRFSKDECFFKCFSILQILGYQDSMYIRLI